MLNRNEIMQTKIKMYRLAYTAVGSSHVIYGQFSPNYTLINNIVEAYNVKYTEANHWIDSKYFPVGRINKPDYKDNSSGITLTEI